MSGPFAALWWGLGVTVLVDIAVVRCWTRLPWPKTLAFAVATHGSLAAITGLLAMEVLGIASAAGKWDLAVWSAIGVSFALVGTWLGAIYLRYVADAWQERYGGRAFAGLFLSHLVTAAIGLLAGIQPLLFRFDH